MNKLPTPFGGGPVASMRGEHGLFSISPHSKDEVRARRLGDDLRPVGEDYEVVSKLMLQPLTPAANAVLKAEVEAEVKEGLSVRGNRHGEVRERGPRADAKPGG